jgi:hypothetical protein
LARKACAFTARRIDFSAESLVRQAKSPLRRNVIGWTIASNN